MQTRGFSKEMELTKHRGSPGQNAAARGEVEKKVKGGGSYQGKGGLWG